jgi:hypothetical protein
MRLLQRLQRALATAIESDTPDDLPARLSPPPPARGLSRFSLLLLVTFVVLLNLPFMTRHYMPGHDSKQVLGIFDYMYSSWLFSGELPQWMAYGLHGLDAATFHLAFLSASSYLTIFAGKLLGVTDSLMLFSITLCVEQLCFLLGFYLLSRRLFQEPLTIFCICFTAVGLVDWQTQLFFNLRLFCLLPLAFYLILRLRDDGAGWCGWLAGIVAILGPEGSTYAYVLWVLMLAVFSLGVFWGRFPLLKAMFRLRASNVVMGLLFVSLALVFLGTLWHALDNSLFASPGRNSEGKIDLATFLTYGGNSLADMLSGLLLPSAFMGEETGRAGMADYVGLISLFCLPFALRSLRNASPAYPFAMTGLAIATLSLGGLFACGVYYLPGMQMSRHIGFMTGVIKVLVLILAGFGCDALVRSIRAGTLIPRPTLGKLSLICLALLFYVDLNIGGPMWARVCWTLQDHKANLLETLEEAAAIYPLARAALMFAFAFSAWRLCQPATTPGAKKPDLTLALLVVCIIGDCLLFQSELYAHLHRGVTQIEFPAAKLGWPIVRYERMSNTVVKVEATANTPGTRLLCDLTRFEQVPGDIRLKYQAWTNVPASEYQATVSSVLQWDPPTPQFRVDWEAKNVAALHKVLGNASTQDLATVSGAGGLKFRLLADAAAIHVKTDKEALKLVGSRAGWDKQVILTDPGNETAPSAAPLAAPESRLDLGEFSANSLSLTLSNGLAQPAWLIYADAYSPGWHATVNGKPVPVLSAYGAFKAVKVPAGSSQVRFYYHYGIHSLCLSALAAMAAGAVAVGMLALFWLIVKECFAQHPSP